jgi:excinuclease UvrABC ATPase subunit
LNENSRGSISGMVKPETGQAKRDENVIFLGASPSGASANSMSAMPSASSSAVSKEFNNPFGACPTCGGIGHEMRIDPELVISDSALTLKRGAVGPWAKSTSP